MVKKNITRKDISNKINKKIFFSKNLSSKIVDDFCESIIYEIINFNKIKISSFGTFSVINKKARIGRNPKTKIEAKILPRKVVKFKASVLIKNKINTNE